MITLPGHKSESELDEEDIQFICTSGGIIDQKLREASQPPYRWAYYANFNGLMKTYPSTKVSCDDYDPRFRPWYVSATTGRKNVILIIDVSGSMYQDVPSRISLAKEAAKNVVNTLSPADTVAVITFSDSATSLYFNKIVQATSANKEKIISEIDRIYANGGTSYDSAFRKAFSML